MPLPEFYWLLFIGITMVIIKLKEINKLRNKMHFDKDYQIMWLNFNRF